MTSTETGLGRGIPSSCILGYVRGDREYKNRNWDVSNRWKILGPWPSSFYERAEPNNGHREALDRGGQRRHQKLLEIGDKSINILRHRWSVVGSIGSRGGAQESVCPVEIGKTHGSKIRGSILSHGTIRSPLLANHHHNNTHSLQRHSSLSATMNVHLTWHDDVSIFF